MSTITRRFHFANTKHGYHVEVTTQEGTRETWDVWADTRTQAAKYAKREGAAEVRSVNMYG